MSERELVIFGVALYVGMFLGIGFIELVDWLRGRRARRSQRAKSKIQLGMWKGSDAAR